MKAKEILLQNFRCFEELSLQFDDRLTVIVADNGMGKTTILDGIATAFGRLLTKLPGLSGQTSKYSDIRVIEKERLAPFLRYSFLISDSSGCLVQWSARRMRDSATITKKEYEQAMLSNHSYGTRDLDKLADSLVEKEIKNQPYVMPVVAYYGTSRAVIEIPKNKRGLGKSFNRFESLSVALNAITRFRDAFIWFLVKEDEERRAQVEQRNFDYKLPELQAVRRAVASMLPGISNFRTAIRPLRFIVDWEHNGKVQTLRVEQLSDGYKTTLAMVMDIARRMAQANPSEAVSSPSLADPLKTPAIILIDEVDLHLHPSWQQRILTDLLRTFENAQFIVTTHSPQVVTTVHHECIRKLNNIDGRIVIEIPVHETYAQESRTTLEDVFDVGSRPPLDINKKLQEYLKLVESGEDSTVKARQLREEIEASMGAGDPQLQLADMLIARNAARKGQSR